MGPVYYVMYMRPSGRDVPHMDAECMGKSEGCAPEPRAGERMKLLEMLPAEGSQCGLLPPTPTLGLCL